MSGQEAYGRCAQSCRRANVAELDRFEKTFTAGWRAAYNYARGGTASDGEVSDKLVKSLAKNLREQGGVPGFREMSEVIASGLGPLLDEPFAALDRIVRDHDGHRHTKLAAEAAKFILISRGVLTGSGATSDAAEQFAVRTCESIIEHKFFANARQHLVTEEKLPGHGAAYDWQHRLERLNQPALGRIAGQLIESPSAEGLRAPRRSVPVESTSTLLDQDLLPAGAPQHARETPQP